MVIPGGYYIKSRKIQESEISTAPPHVREIWDWLLREANHKDTKIGGTVIKRGQLMRSYKDIQEDLHWMVGYRKETYKKWHCEIAMKWLANRQMITTTKTTRGMLITVCNYNVYQDPKNYDNDNERHKKATRRPQGTDTINKNDKNEKNYKNISIPAFDEFKVYALSNEKNLDIANLRLKYLAWVENGWKDGNNKEIKNWKSKLLNTIPHIKTIRTNGHAVTSPKVNEQWNR